MLVMLFITGVLVGFAVGICVEGRLRMLALRRQIGDSKVKLSRRDMQVVAWLMRPLPEISGIEGSEAAKYEHDLPGARNGAVTGYLLGTHDIEKMEQLLDERCGLGDYSREKVEQRLRDLYGDEHRLREAKMRFITDQGIEIEMG